MPGYVGLFTAVSMTVGAFRNVSHSVDSIAAFNNSLLPIWLIILGVTLMAAPSIGRASAQRSS